MDTTRQIVAMASQPFLLELDPLERGQSRIPKFVYFIDLVKPENNLMPFVHFAAIASARSVLRPDRLTLCLHGNLRGPWWERASMLVDEVRHVELPTRWREDKPIRQYAHMADYIAMNLLRATGGICLDMDTISVRPVDDLLQYECVLGREAPSQLSSSHPKLGNAVVMSAPGSSFMEEWFRRYPDVFDGDEWERASTMLPAIIARERPDLAIHIESEESFYVPSWDNLPELFERPGSVMPEVRIQHLWQQLSWERYLSGITSMSWARENKHTLYAKLLLMVELSWIRDGIDYGMEPRSVPGMETGAMGALG